MEYNLARAAQTAYKNSKKKSVFTMARRKTLQEALDEAARPLTAQQECIRKRVEAKGFIYAVNGSGEGCVFNK